MEAGRAGKVPVMSEPEASSSTRVEGKPSMAVIPVSEMSTVLIALKKDRASWLDSDSFEADA